MALTILSGLCSARKQTFNAQAQPRPCRGEAEAGSSAGAPCWALRQRTTLRFEQEPRLLAEFPAPAVVKAVLFQALDECRSIGLVEHEPRLEPLGRLRVGLDHVFTEKRDVLFRVALDAIFDLLG